MDDRSGPLHVAVIGGGIIGSWAALHLIEAGIRTTLVEQYPMPHTRGSSHGLSRAFRFLGEHELARLDYSLDRWLRLEEESGHRLFVRTGLLNFGPPGDQDLELFMRVLREADRPVEWLDADEIAARFPMLRYPAEWGAARDPNGGILVASTCLAAVQARFVRAGGRILPARIEGLSVGAEGNVTLSLRGLDAGGSGTLSADRVVACAGAWSASLVPEVAALLRCLLIPVTYWRDTTGRHAAQAGFPILFNARLTGVYSLPAYEYPGAVKVLFHGGPETDPELRDLAQVQPWIDRVRTYVAEHLPELDASAPAVVESCLYTMTPDGLPVIDRLPSGIVVGCGFSGSGFKHAPATGLMLAQYALGRELAIDPGFRRDRYLSGRFAR